MFMKKTLSILLSVISLILLVGCNRNQEVKTIHVRIPFGAPTLGMVKMIHDVKTIDNYSIEYDVVSGPDMLVSAFTNKSHEFIIAPTNVGAKLYINKPDYLYAATITMGNLYIISSEEITLDSLVGQTIHAFGAGSTPEIVLRKVIGERDITIQFEDNTVINSCFVAGTCKHILIAEPALSMVKTKKDITTIIDLQEEYKKLTGIDHYPQAALFVNKKFADKHKDVVKKFINEVKMSVQFVNNDKDIASAYYEAIASELNQNMPRVVIKNSIPGSNIYFVSGKDSKPLIDTFFSIVLEFNKELIGNKIPDENFYWSDEE